MQINRWISWLPTDSKPERPHERVRSQTHRIHRFDHPHSHQSEAWWWRFWHRQVPIHYERVVWCRNWKIWEAACISGDYSISLSSILRPRKYILVSNQGTPKPISLNSIFLNGSENHNHFVVYTFLKQASLVGKNQKPKLKSDFRLFMYTPTIGAIHNLHFFKNIVVSHTKRLHKDKM